jgi:5-methylcytosine-specific restriction endonuclease McrA
MTAPPRPRRCSRLTPAAYKEVKRQVLERDHWSCQYCGGRTHLEVHHIQFRSHRGEDCELNLITLCTPCHRRVHEAGKDAVRGEMR